MAALAGRALFSVPIRKGIVVCLKMFHALFKPKFYSKCNSRLKLMNTRLERIRKKRNAVKKFLKKDIADLLRSDLDYNAYGRAEGLLVEQNMTSCYELIANFAACVASHLRDLCKHRDCPRECKQAMQSLIYAAARFSDLPELRELRTLFTEKFGNSLEPYISIQFVEKLKQEPPSKEMKIQLLHDLAQEFSIEWDSKALQQRLKSPTQLHEEKIKHGPLNDHGGHKKNDVAVPKIDNLVGDKQRDSLSQGRKDITDAYWRVQSGTEDETTTDNSSLDSYKARSSSLESVSEDEAEVKRPISYKLVPPPYVKEKMNKGESNLKKVKKPTERETESNHDIAEPVVPKKPIPKSVRRRPQKLPPDDNTVSDSKIDITDSEKAKQHQQTKVADEEERIMDRLLIHYSKKQCPRESGIAHPLQRVVEYERGHRKQNLEITSEDDTSMMETLRTHGRVTSLVPEMLRTARHVHPSLPDYDDLSARLADLKKTAQPA
ncbi:hypothetical protein VNO78_14460 [Psophocarpus tetragonolobus]|uniref:Uncharacterized protein n=1 Tax=Psophocarpus tetragonolobus TaxID=3891 RepID=A0AAN9SRF6_PSOTE